MEGAELDLLKGIADRLERLEQKVESIVSPPRALKLADAEKLLPIGKSSIKELIRKGSLRTVEIGDRRYIPMSEIIRLTSVREQPKSSPSLSKSKRGKKAEQLAAADEIRALARELD